MTTALAYVRRLVSSDEGTARTRTLAGLVGVVIVAAAAALIFIAFNNSNSDNKSNDPQAAGPGVSDVGRNTTTSPAAPTTSAAAKVNAPKATKPKATKPGATKPKATKPKATKKPAAKKPAAKNGTSARKPVTYIVKHGDNLTVIAAWFHQHGYGKLYDLNKSVIGKNPNLIHPGQKITIAHGSMTVRG